MKQFVEADGGMARDAGEIMTNVTKSVLATVNAPYGSDLSAQQLAAKIVDPTSLDGFEAPVFAFFSEVSRGMQHQFIHLMGVDEGRAHWIADQFAIRRGTPFPLSPESHG